MGWSYGAGIQRRRNASASPQRANPGKGGEAHLANAVRYVSLNPVRAGLVQRPEAWRWSSVAAHLAGKDDGLVTVALVLERYGAFADFLGADFDEAEAYRALRRTETSGRPIGSEDWVAGLEARTGRLLAPQKRGPKPKVRD